MTHKGPTNLEWLTPDLAKEVGVAWFKLEPPRATPIPPQQPGLRPPPQVIAAWSNATTSPERRNETVVVKRESPIHVPQPPEEVRGPAINPSPEPAHPPVTPPVTVPTVRITPSPEPAHPPAVRPATTSPEHGPPPANRHARGCDWLCQRKCQATWQPGGFQNVQACYTKWTRLNAMGIARECEALNRTNGWRLSPEAKARGC
jgi:hypothetical protein